MSAYRVCLNQNQMNHFLRSGSLELYSGQYGLVHDDHIFVSLIGNNSMYGPFNVIDGKVGIYAFTIPAILCEVIGRIQKYMVSAMDNCGIDIIEEPIPEPYRQPPTISGSLELDGLLASSFFDDRVNVDCVKFCSRNEKLITYYLSMLDEFNIEHYVGKAGNVFINSLYCNQCRFLDSEYYGCKEFVQGYLAPQMYKRRTLECVMRDSPPELENSIVISDNCNLALINRIDGSGIIVNNSVYKINRIYGLSVRMHPFYELICDRDDAELLKIDTASYDCDNYRIGASVVVIRNIFRLSGYTPVVLTDSIFSLESNNTKYYIMVLKNIDSISDDSVISFIGSHVENGFIIVLKNDADPYLKIQKCSFIKHFDDDKETKHKWDLSLFQNFESNGLLPVHTVLTSELRYKIHLIWEI